MRELMTKTLADEYEVEQLVPVESDTDNTDASHEQIEDLVGNLPESASVEMRMAVFEAVIDELIEEKIDDAEAADPDGAVVPSEIEDSVSDVVDTAVALHLVPSVVKRRVPRLIARRLRRRNPQYALIEKAAVFMTDAMVDIQDDQKAISEEVVNDVPVPDDADITQEIVTPTPQDIQVSEDVPDKVADALRYLAASRVNQRKATALVSKRISGHMLQDTLHALRYQLPDKFKRKFGVR